MSDDMDERYATAREHWELREDVAGLKADMRQIGPQLTRIETMIAAKATQQAPALPPSDPNTLALHNAADAMRQAVQAMANRPTVAQEVVHAMVQSKAVRGGSVWPWVVTGAAIAVAAFVGWHQLTGH